MEVDGEEFDRLQRLRSRFLGRRAGDASLPDYWTKAADLASYDRVFAARIGWKWDAVIDELVRRGFAPRADSLVDWGCGSGIAVRRWLTRFRADRVFLHDRSPLAIEFAEGRLAVEQPSTRVERLRDFRALEPELLLVSHVLNELDEEGEAELSALVERAHAVVWVEPGEAEVASRLERVRDRLLPRFQPFAPCTHTVRCPALFLRSGAGGDWCHFFAEPANEVFHDAGWGRLARDLRIDLRSLPYSFLALLRRESGDIAEDQGGRIIGRPDVASHEVRIHLCDAAGLHRLRVMKSEEPALHRDLKKGRAAPVITGYRVEKDRLRLEP